MFALLESVHLPDKEVRFSNSLVSARICVYPRLNCRFQVQGSRCLSRDKSRNTRRESGRTPLRIAVWISSLEVRRVTEEGEPRNTRNTRNWLPDTERSVSSLVGPLLEPSDIRVVGGAGDDDCCRVQGQFVIPS